MKSALTKMVQTITGKVSKVTLTASGSTNGIIGLDLTRYNQYDTVYKVPVAYPYGYCSIPPKNANAIISNMSVGNSNSMVTGFLYPSLPSALSLIENEGESIWFSNGIGINLLNNNLSIKYGTSTCSLPSGEDIGTILSDILSQLKEICTKLNANATVFNAHTHSGNGVATTTHESSITIDSTIQRDLNFVTANKHLINTTTGITPVS
jgi:hypothetical protein